MNTQPEALRLAEEFENDEWIAGTKQWQEEAAAELRRLHERNEDLLNRLFRLDLLNEDLVEALEYHQEQTRPIQKTIDALAKARGNT